MLHTVQLLTVSYNNQPDTDNERNHNRGQGQTLRLVSHIQPSSAYFPYFEKIKKAYEITLLSVCVSVYPPLSLLGNGSVKMSLSLLGNGSVKCPLIIVR
jgi:hypothetical protein